ncbi:IclR family transcriptional regulator [Microbacterium sp.]|uniref:IclR family transcriptional regulator n=1 Tax=Microbacterium sp. TaxID=51671 RepID=UPI003A83ECFF
MRAAQWNEPVSVLDRILAIIDVLGEDGSALCIAEIADRTGLPKSTASRLIAQMVEKRYLTRTPVGVALGLRMFELGARANLPRRLRAVAHPVLTDLHRAVGERVVLAVRLGSEMLKIASVQGRMDVGALRVPATTAATGKAWLAYDEVGAVTDSLRAELDDVRATSFSFDREETFPGLTAVGSPVLSPARTPIAAVAISGPTGLMDPARTAPLVGAAAVALSRRFAALR